MTKKELRDIIKKDSVVFQNKSKKTRIWLRLVNDHSIQIMKYLKYLRYEAYFRQKKGFFSKILAAYYCRKKNNLGNKLGFYIGYESLGENVSIYHHGSIIINEKARLGKGCKLHGNNCIGNNGYDDGAPIIGDNVDIGFGAIIIGNITIANNCKIGAGAVVINDCLCEGATLVGVPARIII